MQASWPQAVRRADLPTVHERTYRRTHDAAGFHPVTRNARQELAQTLKAAREAHGYTVRGLASKIHKASGGTIGGSYITDLEKMRSVPSSAIAVQLAHLLELDEDEFTALCDTARTIR